MTDYKQKYNDLIQSIVKREDIPADFHLEVLNDYEEVISEEEKKANQKPSMTKADVMAIKDTVERQKAIKENIHLFQ